MGAALVTLALGLWVNVERPVVLVSQSGGLIGAMGETGRSLSKPKGDGFTADSWLENDGDVAEQALAALRGGFDEEGRRRRLVVGGATILHATGKRAAEAALAECHKVSLVILNVPVEVPKGCRVYDRSLLDQSGALAISLGEEGLEIVSVRDVTGVRLWSR